MVHCVVYIRPQVVLDLSRIRCVLGW